MRLLYWIRGLEIDFFIWAISVSKTSVNHADYWDIFDPTPLEIDFEILPQILKLRRCFIFKIIKCVKLFTLVSLINVMIIWFDVNLRNLTPVISNFVSVLHLKPYFSCRPLWQYLYQKTWDFIAHLLKYVICPGMPTYPNAHANA